jgi:hypothetical protein
VATHATHNQDGTVHVIPVWFRWDGEAILVATRATSRKARNATRDPRVTVLLHSPGGLDVRGLTVYGCAESIGGEEAIALTERIHLEYVTACGLAIPSVARFLGGEDLTIRIVPECATAFDETGSEAARELRERGELALTKGIR